MLRTLNDPDLAEGIAGDYYTAEKQIGNHRVYISYYRTLPLGGNSNDYCAIVDCIGYSAANEQPSRKETVKEPKVPSRQG